MAIKWFDLTQKTCNFKDLKKHGQNSNEERESSRFSVAHNFHNPEKNGKKSKNFLIKI